MPWVDPAAALSGHRAVCVPGGGRGLAVLVWKSNFIARRCFTLPGKRPISCDGCGGRCWSSPKSAADGRQLCRSCRPRGTGNRKPPAPRCGCGTVASYKRGCRCSECREASRVEAKAYRESRIAQGMLAQKRRTDRVYRKPEAYPDCVVCGETVLNGMVRSDAPMHNSCRPSGRQIAISKKDRLKIYMRDRLICQLCDSTVDLNLPTTDRWAATLDHIIPYSLGGSDDESNLRLTHRSCNSRRGAPSEAAEAAA